MGWGRLAVDFQRGCAHLHGFWAIAHELFYQIPVATAEVIPYPIPVLVHFLVLREDKQGGTESLSINSG